MSKSINRVVDTIVNLVNDSLYRSKLRRIINHFGIDNQIHKFHEETGELTGAIVRYNGGFLPTNQRIIEEFADVIVIMSQIAEEYEIDLVEVDRIARAKPDEVIQQYYIDE